MGIGQVPDGQALADGWEAFLASGTKYERREPIA